MRARLTAINGSAPQVDRHSGERERERAQMFAGREQNLSWRSVRPGERVIEGISLPSAHEDEVGNDFTEVWVYR